MVLWSLVQCEAPVLPAAAEDTRARQSSHQIRPQQMEKILYSQQQIVYLDPDETFVFRLNDGTEKEIRLVSVEEREDPVIQLVRSAVVHFQIAGEPTVLICRPYSMPTKVQGIRIQVDTTSKWLKLPKRIQISVWDASDPIVDPGRFRFPLPEYRLFSHGMQAYNEPVHLGHRDGDPAGQRFYHNYGVDLAGYEGRQEVVSCIDGVVARIDRGRGSLSIRDDQDFVVDFGHLDSILSGIEVGTRLSAGQPVGMLGKRGASGNFSHLHVGAYLSTSAMHGGQSNRNLNLYPWIVAAYLHRSEEPLFAVARPHKMALVGDPVRFDATRLMTDGSVITSSRWLFHNGHEVAGPRATRAYDQPGCYMATLWCEGHGGQRDVDFCKVKVFSRSSPEPVIPTLFVTRVPANRVRVGQPVTFRAWAQGAGVTDIRVDFDDGTTLQGYQSYAAVSHTYRTSGIYVVSFSGRSGSLPVTQKLKVAVLGP